MSGCSRHPSKEAIGACIHCGKLTCAICHVELDGKSYCQPCADKLFAIKAATLQETKPDVIKPSKSILKDSSKSAGMELEKKDKTVIAVATAAKDESVEKKAEKQPAKVGWVWWIPPALLGWIGGLLSWFANKDSVPKTARNMLFGGIGMSVLHGIVGLVLVLALLLPVVMKQVQKAPNSDTGLTANTAAIDNKTEPGTSAANNPPIDYKLTPLDSEAVEVSDKDQTVSYQDKLKVTIPGGQLKEAQKLVISSVGNPPTLAQNQTRLAVYDISFEKQHEFDKDLTISFTYDLDSLPQGTDPESLQISFLDEKDNVWLTTPSDVDSVNHTVTVQTAHNGCWQIISDVNGKVALLTDHFVIYFSPREFHSDKLDRWFELDKKEQKVVAGTDNWTMAERQEWANLSVDPDIQSFGTSAGYKGNIPDQDKDYYTKNPYVPRYIADIGYFLETTLKKYEVFGREPLYSSITFITKNQIAAESERTVPMSRLWTIDYRETIPSPGFATTYSRMPVYVDISYINPQYSGITKSIYIGYAVVDKWLPFYLAHELFHAIQNADYWFASRQALGQPANFLNLKDANLWWFESTADYASWKIANGSDKPTNQPIDPGYLGKNFFCNFAINEFITDVSRGYVNVGPVSSDPCNKDHPYQNAWFWNYLGDNYDADFVGMYTKVRDSWSVRSGLEAYVRENLGCGSLFEAYRDFAVEVLFDKDGPYKGDKLTTETLTLPLVEPKSYNYLLQPGMSAVYLGAVVQGKDYKGERKVSIRLDKLQVSRTTNRNLVYDIYKLRGNERGISNLEKVETWKPIEEPDKPTKYVIDLAENEAFYVVVTYDSRTNGTLDFAMFNLILEDEINPTLSIIPPQEVPEGSKGTTCIPYTFEAKPGGMPKGVSYTWYIDDVETVTSTDTTMKHAFDPGPHRIKVVAIWGKGDSEGRKDAGCAFYIGNSKLTIEGPAELKPGEKGTMGDSYTFTVKPEYVPDSATYIWDSGATGPQRSFTQLGPGQATIKVTGSWDADGCKGKVDGSTTFEFANQSIDIIASPTVGTEGGTTTFTATGDHIPRTAMFSWEVGDLGGMSGVTMMKIDAPVSHRYDSAGTYAVKVTVIDKQGYTGASKQIKYTVNAVAPTSNQVPQTSTQGCTLKIQPTSVNGEPGTYTFTASQTTSSNPIFIWDIDGSPIQNSASNTFSANFKWVGTGKVTVTLVDGGKQLCAVTAPVTIRQAAQIPTPIAPTPTPTGTGWYLDGAPVIQKNKPNDDTCYYWGNQLTVGDGSASGSYSWGDCNNKKGCSGKPTGTVTWTRPPSFMKPGDKVNFTMSEKTAYQNTCAGTECRCSGGFLKVEGTLVVEVRDSLKPADTGTYTVTTGSPGDKLAVVVAVRPAGQIGTVTYNYIYK